MIIEITIVTLFYLAALFIYWFLGAQKVYFLSAPSYFLFSNTLFFLGSVLVADQFAIGLKYLLFATTSTWCFVFGVLSYNFVSKRNIVVPYKEWKSLPYIVRKDDKIVDFYIKIIFYLSLGISILFIIKMGYHVLIEAAIGESGIGYSALRTGVHYGGRYLYIGYVTQFKDVLLPLCVILFIARDIISGRFKTVKTFLYIFLCLFFLTTTGKRSPIVMFFIYLFVVYSYRFGLGLTKYDKHGQYRKLLIIYFILLFAIWSLINTARGWSEYTNLLQFAINQSVLFIDRVIEWQGVSNLRTMSIVFEMPVIPFKGWVDALITIAPGFQPDQLSSQMHYFLYKSERGAVGLPVWGYCYLNLGTVGTFIFATMLGFLMQAFSFRLFKGPKTIERSVFFIISGILLGCFFEPFQLVLNGFVTLFIFMGSLGIWRFIMSLKRKTSFFVALPVK